MFVIEIAHFQIYVSNSRHQTCHCIVTHLIPNSLFYKIRRPLRCACDLFLGPGVQYPVVSAAMASVVSVTVSGGRDLPGQWQASVPVMMVSVLSGSQGRPGLMQWPV